MKKNLSAQIVMEICKAITHLSGGKWNAAKALARVLSEEAQKNGAGIILLCTIGSWGDTLTDEEMLEDMTNYNEKGYI